MFSKNASKREFERLTLCNKLPKEKSLKCSNIKNVVLKMYIQTT